MAAKKTSRANNKAGKAHSRRTPASGGAPTRVRRKAGNPGFAGYEYQIEVTIWVALDLMLAKNATTEIMIEPPSDEDLEAAIQDSGAASLDLTAPGERLDLVVQAKTRSGSPWSTSAIADVLLGKEAGESGASRKRTRPLDMLQAAQERRYVFVTNEASAEGLRPHEGEHLFDFPEVTELPPHSREGFDAKAQASLAPRILLLAGVTREVLTGRIGGLLSQHGHVPSSEHDACLRDLRDAVRKRIEGEKDGRLTRSELLDVLVRHGGSVAPTRDMDHYVRPSSFDAIKERLDKLNAVVISGPSGTGKTLTADILELELRRRNPPYDVVGEENGPGHVRRHLTRIDSVLFHLRDPWGGNRLTPGADRWSGELPKLFDRAGPGRKFLVTSRSDVLQSAGFELMKDLQPYVVSIEVEDYGPEKLAKIYDGIASDLSGHARSLAREARTQALKKLSRPYEVKRFLVALSRENAKQPRKFDDIIADSQIEAISKVIAVQIAPFGLDGVQSAAVVWAMLSARGAVARGAFAKLMRRMRTADPSMRPDVEGLIDFLIAGQNLRQDGGTLAFYHPRVEDGLRLAFLRRPNDAEYTLASVVNTLTTWDQSGADWGLETAVGVMRATVRIEDLQLELTGEAQKRLDAHLAAAALSAEKRFDFERALQDLARFGSANHAPSRLAQILVEGGPEPDEVSFRERWRVPPLGDTHKVALKRNEWSKPLIERFIREVLPFTHREYHPELVGLLQELATDLHGAYWEALDVVADPGGPSTNIDAIVYGALMSDPPDFERVIARFAKSDAEAGVWFKGFASDLYEAEEHAVDADAADHVLEEPSERFFNARKGMKVVVRLRHARDGAEWIAGSPHRKLLIYALAELVAESRRTPKLAELQLLLENADSWARDQAWRAAHQHWNVALKGFLVTELMRSDMDQTSFREQLIKIAALDGGGDPVPTLLGVFSNDTSEDRRLELVYDVMATTLEEDPKGDAGVAARRSRAEAMAKYLNEPEQTLARSLIRVLAGEDMREVAATLSPEVRNWLSTLLPRVSIDVAGPLACLAAAAGLDVGTTVQRLLSTDDAEDGSVGVQALLIANGPDLQNELMRALGHKRYRVRRQALRHLVPDAGSKDRVRLIATSDDHSADVRLAFANLMEVHRWPEAVDALIVLLGDTRNFTSRWSPGASWSRFAVARAAARALGAYEKLPEGAVDALINAAQAQEDDPFVACAALAALADLDDERITPTLLTALNSPGLDGTATYRPRAQAAAWAFFDRAIAKKLDALGASVAHVAEHAEPAVAGPLLLGFGALGGDEYHALTERLSGADHKQRLALVRTAAIVVNKADDFTLDMRERNLLRLVHGDSLGALSADEREALETWSRTLDVSPGFERYMAWIAESIFSLPLMHKLGQIRAFDVPDRIGVLTMRSLSPYREEDSGADEGR